MRYFVTGDDKWELTSYDFDREPAQIDARFAPILNATDPDLSRFAARGGKLILFHGMADAAIPFGSSIDYFDSVGKKMGVTKRDAFTRLFLAPGMQHCFAGPGPSFFGGNNPAEQPLDPSTDLSAALEVWVEQGAAPNSVRAIKPKNLILAFTDSKQAGVERSGLLCAYPQQPTWSDKGEAADAANYTCK
jgi:feruloyl esterase